MGRYDNDQRHVDQIWNLHCSGDKVYAGVSEAGLFVSEDQGETWRSVEGFNEHPERGTWGPGFGGLCAHTILTDANNPDRIWVGVSSSGAFRSDDGGKTWVANNEGVAKAEGFCVHSMASDPMNADVIYRQDHRGFYRSDDAGDTWASKENGLPMAQLSDDHKCVFGFPSAFDPASGSVFAVPLDGDNFRFPKDGQLAVYRSQNKGESWQQKSKGLPGNVYSSVLRNALATDSESPAGVYFGTASGTVYASSDLGETWQALPSTFPRVLCVEAFS